MRRTAPLLLATALTGGLALSLAQPASAAEDVTVTAALVTVVDDGKDVQVDTDLYVPEGASATDKRPAVLMTHGFGLTKSSPEVTSMASFLSRNGYVVLTYSSLGFGASGGCVSLQSADHDIDAASQLIDEVLEPRPDVLRDADGVVVGTVGGSYGGGGQLVLAGTDDRVKASVPSRTWNSLQYALDPNNYVVPGDTTGFDHTANEQGVFKQQWTELFFALGNVQPAMGGGGCPESKLEGGDPVEVLGTPCTGYRFELCQTFAEIFATGNATPAARELLARASAATFLDDVDVPVLLTQGQSDTLFNLNDALATYTALKARGVPASMIWNAGGHGGYDSMPGECEVFGGGTGSPTPSAEGVGLEGCYLTGRTLAFFDEHLRGIADPSPDFTWFRDWTTYAGSGPNDEQYGGASAYPAMPDTVFTLSGSDALVRTGAEAGSAQFLNPLGGQPAAYSETSDFTGPTSSPRVPLPPTEQPGQSVSFTSEKFAVDTESVGVPSARLRLSHVNGQDLVLFGKVFDVAPDGSSTLIKRLIAPVRIPDAALDEPVDVKLLGFAHRFEAGHSVRLTLASTDATSKNALVADAITVATGEGSTFSLPTRAITQPRPQAPVREPVAAPPSAPNAPAGPGLATTGLPAVLPAAALLALAGAAGLRRRTR